MDSKIGVQSVKVAWLGGLLVRRGGVAAVKKAAMAALSAVDGDDMRGLQVAIALIREATTDAETRDLATGLLTSLERDEERRRASLSAPVVASFALSPIHPLDVTAADEQAREERLTIACRALEACGAGKVVPVLVAAPGGQISGIVDALTKLRVSCAASRDWITYDAATSARDALGALWSVL